MVLPETSINVTLLSVGVCVSQYVDDVEDDEFPRARLHRAGKKKSAKKTITQVCMCLCGAV